jgi:hypothetical protein
LFADNSASILSDSSLLLEAASIIRTMERNIKKINVKVGQNEKKERKK